MNSLLPIFSAIFYAGSQVLDKFAMFRRKVHPASYIAANFYVGFGLAITLLFFWRMPFSYELFRGNLWLLFLILVFASLAVNIAFFRSLASDDLGEIKTLDLLRGLPVIFISSAIFEDERNVALILLAFISSLAIVWSHWEAKHFKITGPALTFLLVGFVTAPINAVAAKELLRVWNPILLSLAIISVAAIFLTPIFLKKAPKMSAGNFFISGLSAILGLVGGVFMFFSYKYFGIIYTVLLMSLEPLLTYFSAIYFLKEKINRKKLIAFFIVLAAIVLAQVTKSGSGAL